MLWHHLSIDVEPGEFIAVLGPNGTGKTSLLKTLLGQYRLYEGTVEVNGHAAYRGDADVGYVPQQRGVDRDTPLRARDLVRFGIDGHRFGFGLPNRKKERRVDELLEQVGATDFADSPVGILSGGELQRLRLAQALASNPKLLLCDEPTGALDYVTGKAILKLLQDTCRLQGMTVVVITHNTALTPMADRVIHIKNGRVEEMTCNPNPTPVEAIEW